MVLTDEGKVEKDVKNILPFPALNTCLQQCTDHELGTSSKHLAPSHGAKSRDQEESHCRSPCYRLRIILALPQIKRRDAELEPDCATQGTEGSHRWGDLLT